MISLTIIGCIFSEKDKVYTNHLSEPSMVFVDGGSFIMGEILGVRGKDFRLERSDYIVTVPDFYIGKYEVTNEEFLPFLNANGKKGWWGKTWMFIRKDYDGIREKNGSFIIRPGCEKLPVTNVSWHGARAYAAWLKKTSGKNYRLPSEAEWEYAARGGQKSKGYIYAGSDDLNEVARFRENAGFKSQYVGSTKKGNELGLYDMSGNLREWCEDVWHKTYTKEAPTDGSPWLAGERDADRVLRGGNHSSHPRSCLVSKRFHLSPDISNWGGGFGFRLVIGDITDSLSQKMVELEELREKANTIQDSSIQNIPIQDPPKLKMVFVEGGSFTMGCEPERDGKCRKHEKAHTVTVPSFYIGKYEVTNQEFLPFLNAKGNIGEDGRSWVNFAERRKEDFFGLKKENGQFVIKPGHEDLPMVRISWYGARAYAAWLKETTGKNYRLPSESEWEYAARGGQKSRGLMYAGSNVLDQIAWYEGNSRGSTHPVGSRGNGNELDILDMTGNVSEWTADCRSYDKTPSDGSAYTGDDCFKFDAERISRGGNWQSYLGNCRLAERTGNIAHWAGYQIGIRLVYSE